MSLEVDVLPITDTNEQCVRRADQIEGVAGGLKTGSAT